MWIQPLQLTLQLMAVSVTIATVIGVAGAWAASTAAATGRLGRAIARAFLAAMIVAIAMPMILHAAAWEATAGKFGWLIMTQTGARADGSDAYGFFAGLVACGWIHGLVGAAMMGLATWYGVSRTPAYVIQQSRLDAGPISAWWRVRLPIAAPWVLAAMLGTAMLATTEMTVVDLYGFRTVADEFYLFYAADPSLGSVTMALALPLVMATSLIVWLFITRRRLIATRRDEPSTVTHFNEPTTLGLRVLASALAIAVAGLVIAVPVIGLVIKLGHEIAIVDGAVEASWSLASSAERLMSAPATFVDEYKWTAIIGLATATVALIIAWPLAAIGRTHRSIEKWLDPATIVLVSLPGPIVGLAVVSFFQMNVPGFRTLYQQTLVPTVLALLVRAVPVAYWIMRSGYRGIESPVLEASRLDASWLRRWWSIDRSILKFNAIAAMLAAAIVASGDVPATLPVLPPGVTTVGTRLFGLLHSGARYQEAALAIWYVGAVVAISLVFLRQETASRVTVR